MRERAGIGDPRWHLRALGLKKKAERHKEEEEVEGSGGRECERGRAAGRDRRRQKINHSQEQDRYTEQHEDKTKDDTVPFMQDACAQGTPRKARAPESHP